MTAEDHVYFRRTSREAHAFVLVCISKSGDAVKAEASVSGSQIEGVEIGLAKEGEPHEVLRYAREQSALTGLDLRVDLVDVDWDPELGTLIEHQSVN